MALLKRRKIEPDAFASEAVHSGWTVPDSHRSSLFTHTKEAVRVTTNTRDNIEGMDRVNPIKFSSAASMDTNTRSQQATRTLPIGVHGCASSRLTTPGLRLRRYGADCFRKASLRLPCASGATIRRRATCSQNLASCRPSADGIVPPGFDRSLVNFAIQRLGSIKRTKP